jgi:hypothetical protein
VKLLSRRAARNSWSFLFVLVVILLANQRSRSQAGPASEHNFPQSKDAIEKVLQKVQPSMAGRLPVVDGFVAPTDHPLDRYRRAYYQTTVQVHSSPSGGSVVRVSTKITAWYADPVASRSGYRLLASNGRLEADLLEQLSDELVTKTASSPAGSPAGPTEGSLNTAEKPTIPISIPRLPETGGGFSSSLSQSPAAEKHVPSQTKVADADKDLEAQARNLEEILKNQAHPTNLVAVKKSGTPVVASPSLTAKTLFLASAHDEFEMLDFNQDWVHVRITGLARGWIWRNSLEMPDGVPDVDTPNGSGLSPEPAAEELFHVTREETAPFPGGWKPLRNKTVKIISVQKVDESVKGQGPELKLEFAKSLLEKNYSELEKKSGELAGIVLIFDSADGGMIATTASTLEQWKAGRLSDSALWHQSYFDPPETFGSAAPSASQ